MIKPISNLIKPITPNWDYFFQLRKKDIDSIVSSYYTNNTIVKIIQESNKQKHYSNLLIFSNYLKQVKILQFKIEDVKACTETTTFKLLLVTKNRLNQITFTQHDIVNKWRDNKIIEHYQTIISH